MSATLSPRIQRPERKADQSLPPIAKCVELTSTSPVHPHGVVLMHKDNFTSPQLLLFTRNIQGVDKIMETPRSWGIEFVLATLKELQLATLNALPFVYTLDCSYKCISDCVEWQPMWKNRKMGDMSDFERGQIVGARLAGASVTKIATLLGVSRATVS
jgi:hypothetical protein